MAPTPRPHRPTRSLKHEYELYVEQEIENYKESVPRNVLLGIGDDAVASLSAAPQIALTEIVLCDEVDRIIRRRLRLPTYETWRRRRVKLIAELRRPEHWGLQPDDVLVRALPSVEGRVLVAGGGGDGETDGDTALYLAANGCDVTALTPELDAVERVMQAAIGAGLASRVHAEVGDLGSWTPRLPLRAVIVSPQALVGLSFAERARAIEALKAATMDGGIHLLGAAGVPGSAGASAVTAGGGVTTHGQTGLPSLEELRSQYRGWDVTIERAGVRGYGRTFLARKGAA